MMSSTHNKASMRISALGLHRMIAIASSLSGSWVCPQQLGFVTERDQQYCSYCY